MYIDKENDFFIAITIINPKHLKYKLFLCHFLINKFLIVILKKANLLL